MVFILVSTLISRQFKRYYKNRKGILKHKSITKILHWILFCLNSTVMMESLLLISERSPDYCGLAIKSCISIKADRQTHRQIYPFILFEYYIYCRTRCLKWRSESSQKIKYTQHWIKNRRPYLHYRFIHQFMID